MGKHLTLPTLRGNNSYSHALKSIILESRWIGYVQMVYSLNTNVYSFLHVQKYRKSLTLLRETDIFDHLF